MRRGALWRAGGVGVVAATAHICLRSGGTNCFSINWICSYCTQKSLHKRSRDLWPKEILHIRLMHQQRVTLLLCVWASFERERNISLTGERPRQTFCITNGNLSSLPKTLFQAFQIYNICIYRDRKRREEFPFFFCIESQMPPTQHMARELAYLWCSW